MAGGKEIRNKIKSIKSTQKITRAMQMVAASKMRKAQEQMQAMRPYATQIMHLAAHLSNASTDEQHSYLIHREIKRVGIIVISSDRGLCGGLNNNLFKQVSQHMREWDEQQIPVDVVSIGNKAVGFFKRYGGKVLATTSQLGDSPTIEQLLGVMKVMLDAYENGDIDRLYVFTNLFVNTMIQKPSFVQLLPLSEQKDLLGDNENINTPLSSSKYNWDYIYEPSSKHLLNLVLKRYLETLIYQSVVENVACEMAARMVAMKAATDNAGNIINELQLIYNKARQGAITQELAEIVGGAAAV